MSTVVGEPLCMGHFLYANMKLCVAIIVIVCWIVCISGAALPGLYDGDMNVENSAIDEIIADEGPNLTRVRRFSCDLFSFTSAWITPNHAVCATKCIATGHRGGSCDNNICHCRGRWGR